MIYILLLLAYFKKEFLMFDDKIEIPRILLDTLTTAGYFRVFYAILQEMDCKTHREAYEILEELREKHHFPRKYTDYASFRRVKFHLLCAGTVILGK